MRSVVSRYAISAAVVALGVAVTAGPTVAQSQPAPGSAPAPARKAPSMGTLEGSVKKVDPSASTVQVSSGFFGFFSKTLEVDDNTLILTEGRPGSLADLQEGTKVKASYETRDGRNIATHIDVAPPEAEKTGARPSSEESAAGQTPGKIQ